MTNLYLVRHGHTLWDDDRRLKGQVDVPLSRLGERQASEAAAYFRGAEIAAVYASTLRRTQMAAARIAAGNSVLISPLLDERNFGLWQGMAADQIGGERAARQIDWAAPPPLGEAVEVSVARAQLFLDLVAHGYVGQNVVAVTHEGFIKNVVLPAIGVPTTNRSAFGAGMGTISLVSHRGAAWRAVFLACQPRRAALEYPPPAIRSEGG